MRPIMMRVKEIKHEHDFVKTFVFDKGIGAKPGQFVMVWVPGIDEKPMSVFQDQPLQLSIASVGYFSKAAHDLKKGSLIGVRGPFGNAFKLKGKRIAMVAGGYGAAPLYFLSQEAVKKKIEVVFIEGVRTKANALYQQELKKLPIEVEFSSDDGSIGFHGNSVQLLEQKMREKKFDCVYSCGPEKMMYALAKLCVKHGVESQVSIERVMKCGFGACGACCVNDKLACYDGTIFTGEESLKLSDFGKTMRDASGKKVFL